MLMYSFHDRMLIGLAAVVLDWLVGDPRLLPHPVVGIGRLIGWLEQALRRPGLSVGALRRRGVALVVVTLAAAGGGMWLLAALAAEVHPWLGYAVSAWFVSTTLAVRGLKAAAMDVYRPLAGGDLVAARTRVGFIVGRDTEQLNESEVARAAIETVAENTVDAFVSPLLFALLGGAPLAMLYRAVNTLDSMVGYKNDKYFHFGWASARFDDGLNWIPARVTGGLLALVALLRGGPRAAGAVLRAVVTFARLHPSPNSGIPEAAVAGALGIELGGRNTYGGAVSNRARMGWPLRPINPRDIPAAVSYLYGVSYLLAGGLACFAWIV